jgi:SAM-dependent methyltransferase
MADPYRCAANHYTSNQRLDYVKRHWERPQFQSILEDALQWLIKTSDTMPALRLADVGAGAGEGFDLTKMALAKREISTPLSYYAIDISHEMLEVARKRLVAQTDASSHLTFIQADVRDFDFDELDANLFLSIGVPFSHLTEEELADVMLDIFRAISRKSGSAVVIIDVLGRYSLEWFPLADTRRRMYTMSFFSNVMVSPNTLMTFYSSDDLACLIDRVLPASTRRRLAIQAFCDRSVFVGRHTMTCLYNPELPPLRTIVNQIAAEGSALPSLVRKLQIPQSAFGADGMPYASAAIECLSSLTGEWNNTVRRSLTTPKVKTGSLCDSLRAIDQKTSGMGMGIGHSLTAILKFGSAS